MYLSLCSGPGGVQCAGSSAEPHQGAQDPVWSMAQTTDYTGRSLHPCPELWSVAFNICGGSLYTRMYTHDSAYMYMHTHTQCALDVTLYNLWVMFTHIMCLRTCTCTCMCVYTVSLCDDCFVKPLMGLIRTH